MAVFSLSPYAPLRSRFSFTGLVSALAAAALLLSAPGASAQTTSIVPLPNTITTVAGGGSTYATTPVACYSGSKLQAYDSFGDGCPGAYNSFSGDLRGGLASDGAGNIYIADTSNQVLRMYDPRTGIVSRVAGRGAACVAKLDAAGDGCPSLQTVFSNLRGIATDPYGNVFVAGYNSNMVQIVCNTASPLCPNTDANHKQVGHVYRIAGCVANSGVTGTASPTGNTILNTSAGTEGDGSFASPYGNLSGDAADGTTGIAGYGSCPGTNTNSGVAAVNQPRGVAADRFGNVYIAETATTGAGLRFRVVLGPKNSTYFSGDNPMWAILNGASFTSPAGSFTYTAHQGYIYTILGGFSNTPAAKGGACGAFTAEDTKGDGCPFYYSAWSSTGTGPQGVAVDDSGNVYLSDITSNTLRVLYAGGAGNPLQAAISANSFGTVTPAGGGGTNPIAAGNVYLLAGGGSTAPSTASTLGSSLALSNQIYKLAVGLNGNLYLGDSASSQVLFYDITDGYVKVLFKSGTPCAAHTGTSTNGDGCPAGGFSFSSSNGLGLAPDPVGNLYITDTTNALIRKVEATSLVPTTIGATRADGSANTQTFVFHLVPAADSMADSVLNSSGDISVGSASCTAAYDDGTRDCSLPITFSPALPGPHVVNLEVAANIANTAIAAQVIPITGLAYGTELVTDSPAPSTVSQPYNAAAVASDFAGNFYYVDAGTGAVHKFGGTSADTVIGTATTTPGQIGVDTNGDLYIPSASSSTVFKLKLNTDGTYTSQSQTVPGINGGRAVVFDSLRNAYVADDSTGSLLLVPAGTSFSTQQPITTIASGFTHPVGVAIDGFGNLFVADSTGHAIYKVSNVNGVYTSTQYVGPSAAAPLNLNITPVAISADQGGNVYFQDAVSSSVLMVPAQQNGLATVTVLSGLNSPSGLTVNPDGTVVSADRGSGTLTGVQRSTVSFNFGTSTSTTFAGTITNAGNRTATGFNTSGLDTAEFPITSISPSNCFSVPPFLPGYSCSFTAQFAPGSGSGDTSSQIVFAPTSSTTGGLSLLGTKSGTSVTVATHITNLTPANPVYSTGTELSFTVTTTSSDSSTATGFVNLFIDNGLGIPYTLTNGTVNINITGLSAGPHSIGVIYPAQHGVSAGTGETDNITIAQATTQLNWTPAAATTQPYSSAIGNSILNASAVLTGTSTPVPGYYQYTASLVPGGNPFTIHAASYLAIGNYQLGVTFTPYDTVNYVGSTANVNSFTVTKASTTAPIGSTQMLVAQDGSGNFTSIQAAVNATSAGGGSIYIKPGTYNENVAIVQPNVALRGLGGDPTQVVLTHQAGAFGGSGVYQYAGEFTTAQTNGYQLPANSTVFSGDEGSATLVVAKGVNTAVSTSQLSPNGFYAENLSLINTYDSDTTKTTTTYLPASNSGTCTANQGPARTYNDLFNAGQLCASQALAIWITSDLAVMNNVYTTSLQDTIYAGSQGSGSNGYVPARQYWFRGKVTGTVDYIFGDAAAVFDYSSIYTVPHGTGIAGTATIEAQNKAVQTGSANDYLSGYVMNSNVFTSYQNGQTGLYFGRPYGTYSTWIMLNSYVDQVNPLGYFEFASNTNNLPTSTYSEYNDIPYTDPATGAKDLNGVTYLGVGGASGAGVTGARETTSQNPGTVMANNTPKVSMTAQQATLYYPAAFLGGNVSSTLSSTQNWNPMNAIAAGVNGFVPSNSVTTTQYGAPFTLLMRPSTPGLGAITNGAYTIPTGTFTLYDNNVQVVTGTLDASGEAFYTSSSLTVGQHSFTWTYSGDANFNGSTTSTALVVTVAASATNTTLTPASQNITYGQSATFTATVTAQGSSYKPTTGSIQIYQNGSLIQSVPPNPSGSVQFTVPGLTVGSYSFQAVYQGDNTLTSSSSSTVATVSVGRATLTITASGTDRVFGAANVLSHMTTGYAYTDSAANVFTSGPSQTTTATRISPVGAYTVTPTYTLSTFGLANYTVSSVNGSFNVTGGAAQTILFAPLPNFPSGGSYQLSARASSGLPVTYTITAGNGIASISGSTLTVTGPGAVTVTATQMDAAGNYATATASRSFTAQ